MKTAIDDNWRGWIGANLMLGSTAEQIAHVLEASGIDPAQIQAEIKAAKASPYVRGGNLLSERIKKRDWLLACYRKLANQFDSTSKVPREHQLSAQDFYQNYYFRHRPVVLSGLIDHWPAMTRWTPDYFEQAVGDAPVQVQFGRDEDASYEMNSLELRSEMSMREFVALLKSDEPSNNAYMTANNADANQKALASLWPDVAGIDGYLDPAIKDRRFFWMGPRGTVTPYHHDLTNNLLVQVSGTKKVLITASFDTPTMRNHWHCFSEWDAQSLPAGNADLERPAAFECEIGPGEALFIPVGWWHHVEALTPTIGLSFTNFVYDNDYASFYTTHGGL